MKTLTVSSSQFHQDDSEAWAASESSPVIITDQRPRVLLLLEDFEKMEVRGSSPSLVGAAAELEPTPPKKFISLAEALAMPDGDDFDFDPPRLNDIGLRVPDFSA